MSGKSWKGRPNGDDSSVPSVRSRSRISRARRSSAAVLPYRTRATSDPDAAISTQGLSPPKSNPSTATLTTASSNRRRPACTSPRASSSSARAASRIICEPSTASRPSSVISSRIRSAAARSPSSSGSMALPTRIARASSSACSRTRIGQAASACFAAPAWSPRTMASWASWACSVASRYGVSGRCSSPSRAYRVARATSPVFSDNKRGPQQRHLGGHRVAVLGQRGHPLRRRAPRARPRRRTSCARPAPTDAVARPTGRGWPPGCRWIGAASS